MEENMTIENAAAMGKARVFQCPKCGEYINTHMTECRFCHAPVNAQEAQTAATQLNKANQVEEAHSDGPRNMILGGLFCVGGILVTAITYSAAASNPTGGRYFVAWGAILFGAIQFFKGLFQMLSK
jgi:predicted RNA-binding Zn-ribbon protein involved in translation (DUF1610 family)